MYLTSVTSIRILRNKTRLREKKVGKKKDEKSGNKATIKNMFDQKIMNIGNTCDKNMLVSQRGHMQKCKNEVN